MGKILGSYLMPHPPILLKEVGLGEEKKIQHTIDAMMTIAREIKEKKPGTIILISPHGPFFRDAVSISIKPELKGDLFDFGADEIKFTKNNNLEMVNKIIQFAEFKNINCAMIDDEQAARYKVSSELDHGAMVPLYFIDQEYVHYKLIPITYGLLPREELYGFGKVIQMAVDEMDEDVIVIASGDLSHVLKDHGGMDYNPSGKEFDQLIIKLLGEGAIEEIFRIDNHLIHQAAECGLRSIDIMLGTCDGYDINPDVLSYEGPFGVGYGVVNMNITSINRDRQFLDKLYKNRQENIEKIRKNEDEYVGLARMALENYIMNNGVLEMPTNISKEITDKKAGVFVSLKKHGELRGCIGTIKAITENIAEEIIRNAIEAGTQDPRFYPIEEDELEEITYSVDVLAEPENINGLEELDVKKYGVIVSSGRKTGLLLPNLENVDTVEEQVKIALQKAGIAPHEGYNLQRFEVMRHK